MNNIYLYCQDNLANTTVVNSGVGYANATLSVNTDTISVANGPGNKFSKAFNIQNAFLSLPTFVFQSRKGSMFFWFKYITTISANNVIASGNSDSKVVLPLNNTLSVFTITDYDGISIDSDNLQINNEVWYHFGFTMEDYGTQTKWRLYLNGEIIKSGFSSSFNSTGNFDITAFFAEFNDEIHLAGIYIDDDITLTQKEIITLYKDGILRQNDFIRTCYNNDLEYEDDLTIRFDDYDYYD